MNIGQLILAAAVGACVAVVGVQVFDDEVNDKTYSKQAVTETRWEKIKRAGVLKCGYVIWPPSIIKDANTGHMSGIAYDLVEEIGKQMNLKIEWTTEAAPAHMASDLAFGKYDMMCSAFLVTPSRAREHDFTTPLFYHPMYVYARKDDTRFDNNYALANAPDVTFVEQDGDFSAIAAAQYFSKAKKTAIPQIAPSAEFFNMIANKKADLVVAEPFTFNIYDKSNPGLVRQLDGPPVFVGAIAFPMPGKEYDFKHAVDQSLIYLQGLGFVGTVLKKYETEGLKFLHLTKPYVDNGKSPLVQTP